MERIDKTIDDGKAFDFGRVSEDYAKFRDIYPKVFYEKIVNQNLCVKGSWEREHLKLLQRTAPKEFTVKHYAAMLRLGKI